MPDPLDLSQFDERTPGSSPPPAQLLKELRKAKKRVAELEAEKEDYDDFIWKFKHCRTWPELEELQNDAKRFGGEDA